MNWYMQSGKDSDVAMSTRIRLARNLNGFKFNLTEKNDIEKLENKIKDNLYGIGYGLKFFKISDMDNVTKMSLVEKNIISPEFVLNKNNIGAMLINDDENICVMINEEDHLRIQVFSPGFDLENTLNLAIELDQKLGETLGYAVSKKYGYLTQSPSDCGTALRASVMMHLPGLQLTENIEKILRAINNFGINIRGMFGENSKSIGDIFQISNEQSLGITEKEIIRNLKVIVEKIINQERSARKILCKNSMDLEDKVYRSYGILANCRKIGLNETLELLSDVKLGVDLGIIKEVTDLKVQKIYTLAKPANLQKNFGNTYDTVERDFKRSELIRKILFDK